MIQHTFGLLVRPSAQWRAVADLPESSFRTLILYPCIFALLPAVAWFYGTSRVGWTVGDQGDAIKLTVESARQICVLFYLAMIGSVAVIGYFVHWMSDTDCLWGDAPRGLTHWGRLGRTTMLFL